MFRKLIILCLLFLVAVIAGFGCKPFEPIAAPGIEKSIFDDPGLKDREFD